MAQETVDDVIGDIKKWLRDHKSAERFGHSSLMDLLETEETTVSPLATSAPVVAKSLEAPAALSTASFSTTRTQPSVVRTTATVQKASSPPMFKSQWTLQKAGTAYAATHAQQPSYPAPVDTKASVPAAPSIRVPLMDQESWPAYRETLLKIRDIAEYLEAWARRTVARPSRENVLYYRDSINENLKKLAALPEDGIETEEDIADILNRIVAVKRACFDPFLEQANSKEIRLVYRTPEWKFYTEFSQRVDHYLKLLGFQKLSIPRGASYDIWQKYIAHVYWEPMSRLEKVGKIFEIQLYPYHAYYGMRNQESLSEYKIGGEVAAYKADQKR